MKQFTCVCGSQGFYLTQESETFVDFSKEGAVEGHPFLGGKDTRFADIRCAKCRTQVLGNAIEAMRKEII